MDVSKTVLAKYVRAIKEVRGREAAKETLRNIRLGLAIGAGASLSEAFTECMGRRVEFVERDTGRVL